ncbi:hypothetical protein J7M23_11240 [Candidatus Sumerlaeota bacterium]|nr:hypothetical protein [Candidatus Sumerlaeota bacterium]
MKRTRYGNIWIVLVVGSVWGVVEAGAGVALRGSCARLLSGSILLGTMMFFLATTYSYSKKKWLILVLPFIAMLFKLYSALLIGLPVLSGAIINPIYAFYTETLAFIIVLTVINPRLLGKPWGTAVLGGMSALVAANMFPAVGLFTGIPACVLPGTRFPLALWGAPVAVIISSVTVPAGFALGQLIAQIGAKVYTEKRWLIWAYTSSLIILCLYGLFLVYR